MNKQKTISGKLIVTKRFGIVKTDEYPDGIEIPKDKLGTGLHGDEVVVQLTGKKTGKVVGIEFRVKTEFTGVLIQKGGSYFLKPSDRRMYAPIFIPQHDLGGASVGDRVYGSLLKWEKQPEGKIIQVLGKPGEHETEMQAIALEQGFASSFPKDVEEEATKIKERGIREEDLADRRDMRGITTFTIDPFDAKDFDDAISVERKENGDVEIGIHIADVSHYVTPGSALDAEAFERGTSVYLVDRTIPMLPHILSDDLCSLLPNVDRLTMSAIITFSPEGEEKDAWFGPTVIHSDKRFTYEEAQEILDGKDHELKDDIHLAAHIARELGKKRVAKGALVLETEEVKVHIDENGKPVKITKKMRTESHTLIEELMLLANRRVALFLEKQNNENTTVIYRTHDIPSEEKSEDLAFFMRSIGHPIKLNEDGRLDARNVVGIVNKLDGGDLKQTVLSFVVRSMAKALYTTKNTGHYGLQFEHYTHFTSPIRRYPDLVIHRMLRKALQGDPIPGNMQKKYEKIARVSSFAEVRAAEAERESVKLKLAEYMSERIGSELEGMITGVTDWGIYVKDKATTAEGLIPISTLGEEHFELQPKLATLVGKTSGTAYRIGDTIKVRVTGADPEKRQIDYEIIK